MGEENLGISSDRQKGKVHSPIHWLNHGASNIIHVGVTTYLSDLEHLDNWISHQSICLLSTMRRQGIAGGENVKGVGCGGVIWQ